MTISLKPAARNDGPARLAAALPRAAAAALNAAAGAGQRAAVSQAERVFDRPTPQFLRAIRVWKATPSKPAATVYVGHGDPSFQDRLNQIGEAEEEGGVVTADMAHRSMHAVPVGVKTDRFGATGRGTVARLLKQKGVFLGDIPGRAGSLGVYQRTTTGRLGRKLKGGRRGKGTKKKTLKLLVALEDAVEYKPRFDFRRTVAAEVDRTLPGFLSASLRAEQMRADGLL
ncbi:hypothetical protein WDZ11_00200 (plasmid) [Roseomonas mucosa]|uniref:hypothetical protein n=1 Tax=Roseomonas mucosa TaxID=207340 RepID=UPI0030CDBF74